MRQKTVNFKAVATTAAINLEGEVIACTLCLKSVNVERFIEFLKQLRHNAPSGQVHLLLDNLPVHHSLLVSNFCKANDMTLLFDAAYSS